MWTDAQRRAQEKYDAQTTVQVHLKLNLKTDTDILAKLDQIAKDKVETKQGYIKRLIRQDIGLA